MYSFFVSECEPSLGVIREERIGVLTSARLSFSGRIIADGMLDSLVIKGLNDEAYIEAKTEIAFAPKLQNELEVPKGKKVFRFSAIVGEDSITDDFHFSVYAKVKNVDGNINEVLFFRGFIQPYLSPSKVVLIVGSPRSGTSALGKACRKALNASAHGESHVVEGVYKAFKDTTKFFDDSIAANIKGNLVNAIPDTVLLAEHLNMLRRIYKSFYGHQIYLDKTPGIPMLQSLSFALMAWPHAKVIFCKRRAMENIQSRLIKFPKLSFLQHAKQWRQSFVAWRNTKKDINQLLKCNAWFIEVDQFEMATNPKYVSDSVSRFLGLETHEEKRLHKQLSSTDRPEQTSKNTQKVKSLDDFEWSESQKNELKLYCDKEMQLQHYSYDNSYYKIKKGCN